MIDAPRSAIGAPQQQIRDAILAGGLEDRPICVHASLRSFGAISGGSATLIRVLLDCGCTLMVPTSSFMYSVMPPEHLRFMRNGANYDDLNWITPDNRSIYSSQSALLDEADMGQLPKAVLQVPGRIRGNHPLCSFAAAGPLARRLIEAQPIQFHDHGVGGKSGFAIAREPMAARVPEIVHEIDRKLGHMGGIAECPEGKLLGSIQNEEPDGAGLPLEAEFEEAVRRNELRTHEPGIGAARDEAVRVVCGRIELGARREVDDPAQLVKARAIGRVFVIGEDRHEGVVWRVAPDLKADFHVVDDAIAVCIRTVVEVPENRLHDGFRRVTCAKSNPGAKRSDQTSAIRPPIGKRSLPGFCARKAESCAVFVKDSALASHQCVTQTPTLPASAAAAQRRVAMLRGHFVFAVHRTITTASGCYHEGRHLAESPFFGSMVEWQMASLAAVLQVIGQPRKDPGMSCPSNSAAKRRSVLLAGPMVLCAVACSSGGSNGEPSQPSTAEAGFTNTTHAASGGNTNLATGGTAITVGGTTNSVSLGGSSAANSQLGGSSGNATIGTPGGTKSNPVTSGSAGRSNSTVSTSGGGTAFGGTSGAGNAARGGSMVGGTASIGGAASSAGAVFGSAAGATSFGGTAGAAGSALSSILEPATGALLGLYYGDASIAATATKLGRTVPLHLTYYAWSDDWTRGETTTDLNAGRIPFVCWELFGATLDDIASGVHDTLIGQRAASAKKLNKQLFVDFGAEMNGDWSPWSGAENGQSSVRYIAAYRHVHDIFVAAGATNVIWTFCPNVTSVPDASWNEPLDYYPGDSYVDWMCVDGYNWGTSSTDDSWQSFYAVFKNIYPILASKNKPIIIGEMATTELGGDKAKWISEMIPTMRSQFPLLKGLNWFDVNKETDWRISSSAASEAAFKQMANDAWFVRL